MKMMKKSKILAAAVGLLALPMASSVYANRANPDDMNGSYDKSDFRGSQTDRETGKYDKVNKEFPEYARDRGFSGEHGRSFEKANWAFDRATYDRDRANYDRPSFRDKVSDDRSNWDKAAYDKDDATTRERSSEPSMDSSSERGTMQRSDSQTGAGMSSHSAGSETGSADSDAGAGGASSK